jgi:hypothetical protein
MAAGHGLYVFAKVAIRAGKWTPPENIVATDPFSLDFILQEIEERAKRNESSFSE